MKSIVPVVMAGVLGIYGLIIAVIISTGSEPLIPLTTQASSWEAYSAIWSSKYALYQIRIYSPPGRGGFLNVSYEQPTFHWT